MPPDKWLQTWREVKLIEPRRGAGRVLEVLHDAGTGFVVKDITTGKEKAVSYREILDSLIDRLLDDLGV